MRGVRRGRGIVLGQDGNGEDITIVNTHTLI